LKRPPPANDGHRQTPRMHASSVAPDPRGGPGRPAVALAGLPATLLLLLVFLATQYPHAFSLTFVNDDYFLLDGTRFASFSSLWKRHDLIFGWYRPWSRELHYWALQHVFGAWEPPYHVFSFALWLSVMGIYFAWVRRVAGQDAAAIATAGLASLALWGTPLSWVAGAQDLWVLFFALIFLHLLARDRPYWATQPLALALLSKESADVLPALAVAYLVLVERRGTRESVLRTLHLWLLALTWALTHPLLWARFFGPLRTSLETTQRPSPGAIVIKTLLAQVNLDAWPHPDGYTRRALVQGAVGAVLLAVMVWLAATRARRDEAPQRPGRVMLLGLVWALAGWSILLMPSIGWHAYYGVMGSLGAWLVLGTWLSRWPRRAIVVVALLAMLRATQAYTLSWDWGSGWYLHRAADILGAIRQEILRQHPSFPPASRVYFAHIPNNIGLLAGNGPSLRVWYRDSTLRGFYYSQYAPREDGLDRRDFFFRFDSTAGMIEVHKGPEDVERAQRDNSAWEHDHEGLADLFLWAWDLPAAAAEYGKLGSLPWGTPELIRAGVCYRLMRDTVRAESCCAIVAGRMGYSLDAVRDSTNWLAGQIVRQLRPPVALARPRAP
jgi:hypothetical protein